MNLTFLLANSQILLTLIFAVLYYIDSYLNVKNKVVSTVTKKPVIRVTFIECLYFSLVTQTTVGYGWTDNDRKGHAVPYTDILSTKIINMLQMISIFGVFSFAVTKIQKNIL